MSDIGERAFRSTFLLPLGLGAIAALGGFLRVFDLNLMEFRWDSAYWALDAVRVLNGDALPLVGPVVGSSRVELYNGPALTYLTVLPFALLGPNPTNGAALVALLSTGSSAATFLVGRAFYSTRIGLLAALMVATTPWLVLYGRMLWPPPLLPVLNVVLLWSLYAAVMQRRGAWYAVTGILLGVQLQIHLSAIALASATVVLILLYERHRKIALVTVGAGLLVGYGPVLVHDVLNDWVNLRGLLQLQSARAVQDPLPLHIAKVLWNFSNVLSGQGLWVSKLSKSQYLPPALDWAQGILFTTLFVVGLAMLAYNHARGKNWRATLQLPFGDAMLLLFTSFPLAALILSRGLIQRHYFPILYPATLLLMARGLVLLHDEVNTRRLRASAIAVPALLAIGIGMNLVTELFAYRFLTQTGGEGEYGTVLEDKTRAVEFIVANSGGQFRVKMDAVQESFPYRFLFERHASVAFEGDPDYPTAIAARNVASRMDYRIVETFYHRLVLQEGERVLFQSRGTVIVGRTE